MCWNYKKKGMRFKDKMMYVDAMKLKKGVEEKAIEFFVLPAIG